MEEISDMQFAYTMIGIHLYLIGRQKMCQRKRNLELATKMV